jgi:murein DD-endopeptidase MepM/ murein hydrolase activator NlpD
MRDRATRSPSQGENFEPEGIYLSAPYAGRHRLIQGWGENPTRYARYIIGGMPLKGHNGIDIELPKGTPLLAADNGQVIEVGREQEGYGRFIKIHHWWGESLYAHLHEIVVEAGAYVNRSQKIALSGNTGASDLPHLHFSVRIDPYSLSDGWGGYTNPLPFLNPEALVRTNSSR